MNTDRLSALQRDLVRALAQRDSGFFLTRGGVLVGFVLGHRTTDDLDLFTTDDATMAQADSLARALGAAVGAEIEALQTTPDHRRYLFARARDDDSTRVDFVRSRATAAAEVHPGWRRDGSRRRDHIVDAVSGLLETIEIDHIANFRARRERRDLVREPAPESRRHPCAARRRSGA